MSDQQFIRKYSALWSWHLAKPEVHEEELGLYEGRGSMGRSVSQGDTCLAVP